MVNRSKVDLLPAAVAVGERRPRRSQWKALSLITLLAIAMTLRYTDWPSISARQLGRQDVNLCPQSGVIYPDRHVQLWETLGSEYEQDAFTERAVEWLGGAVRIPYVAPVPVVCVIF